MKTFIIASSTFGKAIPNYFFELSKELVLRGHKVVIVFDGKPKMLKWHDEIIFESWPSRRPTKFKDFIFFFKLCKTHQPDVILGQFGSANMTLIVGKLLGVPNRIVYWHTMFLQLKTDSTKSKYIQGLRNFIKRNLLQHFCTLLMTNSTATKNDVLKNYRLTTPIKVFNYLIPDPFELKPLKTRNERTMSISFVARMDKSKGHHHIIDQLPALINKYPEVKIYFVGDGVEKNNLFQKCLELNVVKNVIFTGPVPLSSVYEIMENSLVHISASYEEAFGLVNAEALAAGTPILANKVGGITDILINEENGCFLELNNKGDLSLKFQKILDNNWSVYSENARAIFVKKFKANKLNIEIQLTELLNELQS